MKRWRRLLSLATLAGFAAALLLAVPATRGESGAPKTATILVTTANNGETSPCG